MVGLRVKTGKPAMIINVKLLTQVKGVIKMVLMSRSNGRKIKKASVSEKLEDSSASIRSRAQAVIARNSNLVPVMVEMTSPPETPKLDIHPNTIPSDGEANLPQQIQGLSEGNRGLQKIYYLPKDFTVRELISLLRRDLATSKDSAIVISVQEDDIPSSGETMGCLYDCYPEEDLHLHIFCRNVSVRNLSVKFEALLTKV